MTTFQLKGYPNPRQEEFFTATARHIAYGGSRGGGKSWGMRRKFVLLALRYPGLKLLLLRRTLPELRENHVIPLMAELVGIAKYNAEEKAFTFPGGARLKLGYCDTEADVYQYQGQEYDVIGLEEATHFTESQMQFLTTCNRSTRTDFKPRMYYTANPGNVGHAWFKRLFIDRDYRGNEQADDYVFIPARVYDNRAIMDNNPEYIQTLEALPEDLRRAHLDGDWDVYAGQYFRIWSREVHVIEPFELPAWWKRFRSLDYGLDMAACYWWAVSPDGREYIYRELYESGLTLKQAAEKIIDMTPKDDKGQAQEKYSYTVASPDLWNKRQETGVSGQEIMYSAGLTDLMKADHQRIPGWRTLREHLQPFIDEQGIKVANLRVFDNCVNLIRTMPLLLHDDNHPEDAATEPHEVTHATDSARYGVMSRPGYTVVDAKFDLHKLPRDLQDDYWNAPPDVRPKLLKKWGLVK